MIVAHQFPGISGRAHAVKESGRPADESSAADRIVCRAAQRLKKSARRSFEFVGEPCGQHILGVVTWFKNGKIAARCSELRPPTPNQPSEPTRPAVLFLERVLHSQITSCSGLVAHL